MRKQELAFLQEKLPLYTLQKEKGRAIFTGKGLPPIIFFWRLKKLSTLSKDTIWIVPDKLFYRYFYTGRVSLYFLKKEEEGFVLYDRRSLQLKKGRYSLPSVEVELKPLRKERFLKELEERFFTTKQTSNFYCKGAALERLGQKEYRKALEKRQLQEGLIDPNWLYLWLKNKLDVKPSKPAL